MYLSSVSSLFRTYLLTAVLSFLVSFNVGASFSSITEKGYGSAWELNNAGGNLVRGVKKSDFTRSVKEFANNSKFADDAWSLFEKEDWKGLESLFKSKNANNYRGVIYPPNDGFVSFKFKALEVGSKIDRYGGFVDEATGQLKDGGKFFANKGEPLTNRALPAGSKNKLYSQYEVIKEIPNVKKGEAIPWFGENGKGIQYQVTDGVDDLIEAGYIRRISTTAPAPKIVSASFQLNRGSRVFSVVQGDASTGWKHIYDRHIDLTRFPKKTKFITTIRKLD